MTQVNGSIRRSIPEPELILMGCQVWNSRTSAPCPVCRGGVRAGDDRTYCARCDSSSPAVEARVLAARLDLQSQSETEKAERESHDEIRRWQSSAPLLTESERRRIWLGYSASGIRSRSARVVNRARAGRDWLIAIGQVPDWTLKIDRHGKVVGRYDEPRNPEESP